MCVTMHVVTVAITAIHEIPNKFCDQGGRGVGWLLRVTFRQLPQQVDDRERSLLPFWTNGFWQSVTPA